MLDSLFVENLENPDKELSEYHSIKASFEYIKSYRKWYLGLFIFEYFSYILWVLPIGYFHLNAIYLAIALALISILTIYILSMTFIYTDSLPSFSTDTLFIWNLDDAVKTTNSEISLRLYKKYQFTSHWVFALIIMGGIYWFLILIMGNKNWDIIFFYLFSFFMATLTNFLVERKKMASKLEDLLNKAQEKIPQNTLLIGNRGIWHSSQVTSLGRTLASIDEEKQLIVFCTYISDGHYEYFKIPFSKDNLELAEKLVRRFNNSN